MSDMLDLTKIKDAADDRAKQSGYTWISPEHVQQMIAEIERLLAALVEISELGDVRCDEAPSIARRALIAAE